MSNHATIPAFQRRAVTQTRVNTPWGNCLEAVIASLLGVTLSEVPDLRQEAEARGLTGHSLDEIMRLRKSGLRYWLAHQHELFWLEQPGTNPPGLSRKPAHVAPLFWIATGPSPRGLRHAVVYADDQLAWDPHPSRAGLVSVESWGILVPLGYEDLAALRYDEAGS